MPLPTPGKKEEKNEFISRCASFTSKEGKMPQKQAIAACFDTWRRHQKKKLYEELKDSLDELKQTSKKIRRKKY